MRATSYNSPIVIAGKNRIAVQCAQYCMTRWPNLKLYILPSRSCKPKDDWQPSLIAFAKFHKLPVIAKIEDIYETKDLILFSCEYDRIIKVDRFCDALLYNIHFSYLPAYKGMYTSVLPIRRGESTTGVTLHVIDEGIDTGDIIDQATIAILPTSTARSIYAEYIDVGIQMFKDNIDKILLRRDSQKPQAKVGSTYYSKSSIDYSDRELDLQQTAWQISCFARSLIFREYQLPLYKGREISAINILDSKSSSRPGVVVSDTNYTLVASTIDYDVEIVFDTLNNLFDEIKEIKQARFEEMLKFVQRIDERRQEGWTLLMTASYYCNCRAVEELIRNGADVNATNAKGTTVLMYAQSGWINSERNNTSCLESLLKAGANPFARDQSGRSMIDYLSQTDRAILVPLLERYCKLDD